MENVEGPTVQLETGQRRDLVSPENPPKRDEGQGNTEPFAGSPVRRALLAEPPLPGTGSQSRRPAPATGKP